jgi:cytidine deaminase
MNKQLLEKAFDAAWNAAKNAYAPYSHFRVGAALVCDSDCAGEDGEIVTGVNVENRSFGLTSCAERNALFAAVGQGKRRFAAVAIASPDSDTPTPPCGACRQVLSEFMPADAAVYYGGKGDERVTTTVEDLYPHDSLHELAG